MRNPCFGLLKLSVRFVILSVGSVLGNPDWTIVFDNHDNWMVSSYESVSDVG